MRIISVTNYHFGGVYAATLGTLFTLLSAMFSHAGGNVTSGKISWRPRAWPGRGGVSSLAVQLAITSYTHDHGFISYRMFKSANFSLT